MDLELSDEQAELRDNFRSVLEDCCAPALVRSIYEEGDDGESLWQPPGFAPTVMLQRSGIQIGVIGLSTMETPQTTLTKHVADLTFTDPVEAVRREAPRLREEGALTGSR